MKKASLRFCISLCLVAFVFACNSEKKSDDRSETRETADDTTTNLAWKEMDEFHLVMAESFHPYMDSTNLEPAKTRADELAQLAAKWAAAPLPERVNNEEVRVKLDKLNTASREFATTAKAGNDEATGKALTDLHHLFHEIQDAWYSGKGEHRHEH
jgi:hypothetical protein